MTRSKISQLHRCLKDKQCRGFTRFIRQKTLNSKLKILENQQGTPNGTPESSDDELSEESLFSYNYEDLTNAERIIHDDIIFKTESKNIKADQVTIPDDKAPQTQEKNYKTQKTHKDEELAGLWSREAQSGIETTSSTIPAVLMSSLNLIQPAAAVSQESPQKPPTPITTKPIERRLFFEEKLKPQVILSSDGSGLEKSTPPKSPHVSTASSRWGPVLTEGGEQEDEGYKWWEWGSPLPSPRARSRGPNPKQPKSLGQQSQRSPKPVNCREEPARVKLGRRIQKREPEHRTEGSRAATLPEAKPKDEVAVATIKLESEDPRGRDIPDTLTLRTKYGDRLQGGTLRDLWKKRKIEEVTGDKEESKNKDKPQDFKEHLEKYSGLVNLGATCYLNAVLQCLSGCTALGKALNNNPATDDAKNKITAHLRRVIQTINREGRTTPYNPSEIHSAILELSPCSGRKKDEQQDAAELLQIVIAKLKAESSQVGKLFEGWQRSSTKCQTCENISRVDHPFTIIALDLDKNKELENSELNPTNENSQWEKSDSIEDLMEKYSIKEELRSANKLECTKCNRLEEAEKNLEFIEGPKVLVTQLKRYTKDKVDSTGIGALPISVTPTKLKQHVIFHREMKVKRNNLQGRLSNTESYALRGVIVHYGEEASKGHYKAFVNSKGNWTEWDDQTGSPVLWKDVRTEEAYLLFWEKKDTEIHNMSFEEPKVVTEKNTNARKGKEEEEGRPNANVEKEMDLDQDNTKRKREEEPANKLNGKNKSEDGARDKKRRKSSDGDTQVVQVMSGTETTAKTKDDALAATSNLDLETRNLDLVVIKDIIADLRSKVESLEEKVRILTIENTNLRGKVEAIRRFSQITEEDEAAFRTCENIIMRSVQGSPTPVTAVKDPVVEKTSQDKNRKDKRHVPNLPQETREENKGRETHSDGKATDQDPRCRRYKTDCRKSQNNKGTRMDIDDQWDVPRLNREKGKRENRHTAEIGRGHRKYLEECFRQQIGLPTDRWQNINIYSFTDNRVAKGYQKVVTTCQGMYYEINENQVDWESVGRKRLTIGGDLCWRGNGVTIYKPTREQTSRSVVPHRFAINLGQQYQQPKLRTDRYYIHVYQTKIGSIRKTLRSKESAREINKRWRKVYLPRAIDTQRARADKSEANRERPKRSGEHNRSIQRSWNYGRIRPKQKVDTRETESNYWRQSKLTEELQKLADTLKRLVERTGQLGQF